MRSRMEGRNAFQYGNYLCIGLVLSSIYILSIQAQNITGFVSIDSGSAPYSDSATTISWEGDDAYLSTGLSGEVPSEVNSSWDNAEALKTFRYFPDRRNKHCYDLPTTTSNVSFLLRAMFLHGSASELTLPIQFDVTVNGSIWFTLSYDIDASYEVLNTPLVYEGIFHSPGSLTHFCLVPDTGTPFISSLELRQFDETGLMYAFADSAKMYLSLLQRLNCGSPVGSPTVRYPDDQFDRLWFAPGDWASDYLNTLSGSGAVASTTRASANNVPPKVMQDAWLNNSADSEFSFSVSNIGESFSMVYAAIYYEEIVANASFGGRLFNVNLNGYETTATASTTPGLRWFASWSVPDRITNFSFVSVDSSPLGPVVNAIELYAQFKFNDSATAARDVDALTAMKINFNLTDWQGDPCFPVSWEWVSCTTDTPARVDKLLLSSMGINASIPPDISDLDALTEIHLNNNSLYGTIPDSLASIPYLIYLYLNDNNLSGEVPSNLVKKLGSHLYYSGNSNLVVTNSSLPMAPASPTSPPTSHSKKSTVTVIASTVGSVITMITACVLLNIYRCSR